MNPSTRTFGETAPNRRHAWYAVLFTLGIFAAALVLVLFVSINVTGGWWNQAVLLFAVPVIGWLVGIALMARGRFDWGVQLGLLCMMLALPLVSLFVAGRGMLIGITVGTTTLFVATLALPPARAQWFIVAGVFAGLAAIALDIFGAPSRIALDPSALPGALLSVALMLFLAIFVLLNFKAYPLRIKLLLAFVVLALLSVGSVTFVATLAIRTALTENAARDLQTRAQAAALAVGITMDRNVDRLSTMSLNKRIQEDVAAATDSYPANEAERQTQLQANGARWASAAPQDALIQGILNNDLSYGLRQFGDVFQGNKELFMTDAYGSMIAATGWRPEYNYRDYGWWQAAYNGGRGGFFIGQPEADPMLNDYGIRIAIPIYAPGGTRAVGVLHGIFTLTALQRALIYNSFGESGKIDLLFPQGQVLTSDGAFRSLSFDEFAQIKDGIGQLLPTLTYRGAPRVSGQAVVGVSDEQPEPYLRSTAWRTIATVDPTEALGLVEAGARAALLAGILAIGAAIFVAFALAQFLTRPIRRLTLAADQVQAGNLAARAPVESTDEIGALANAFNGMTARLQDTLVGLERRVAERTQELSEANQSLQSNSAYLSALSDTSTGLFERQSLNDLLQATVERAGALMGAQHGFVFFQQPNDQEIEMRVGMGLYDDLIGTRAQRGIGLAGTVWQTGKPMVIDDYQTWEGRLAGSRRDALRAVVAVPLKRGAGVGSADDVTVGVIGLAYTEQGRKFGKAETDILQRFAQLASIALDNTQLYTDAEVRVQELGALNTISQLLVEPEDSTRVLEKVGAEISKIFDADFGYVALYNRATQQIEFPYALDDRKRIEIAPMPFGKGLTSQVITTGEPLLLTHATSQDFDAMGAVDLGDGVSPNSLLTAPLRSGDQVVGALSVQRVGLERPYTADDTKLLTTIATNVGVALDNFRLAQATQQRVQELVVLNRIGERLNSDQPFQMRLRDTGQELTAIFKVPNMYIALYDETQDQIEMPFFIEDGVELEIPPRPRRSGFIAHVLETRAPLLVNENLSQRLQELGGAWIDKTSDQTQSYLAVPIMLADQPLGVLALYANSERFFTDADVSFLQTIAPSVSAAIQNERLAQATRQQLAELAVLNRVSFILTQDKPLDERLIEMGRELPAVFGVSSVYVALYDAASNMVRIPFFLGDNKILPVEPFALGPGFTSHVIQTRAPFVVNNDLRAQIEKLQAPVVGEGEITESFLGAPILLGDQVYGVIGLSDVAPNKFHDSDVNLLMTLGATVAASIQNTRLFEQTQTALSQTAYQAQRLGILNQLSADLNRVQDMDELYATAASKTRELFRDSDATFAMLTDNPRLVRLYALQDPTAAHFVNVGLVLDNTLIQQSLQQNRLLNISDLSAVNFVDSAAMVSQGLRSTLVTPLFSGNNEPLGTLNIVSPHPAHFDALDEQLASQIGSLVSAALQNRRLFEQTQNALAETQRLATQARQATEQVTALNRRLTREGWQDYARIASTTLVAEAVREQHSAAAQTDAGNGGAAPENGASRRIQVPIVVRGETIGTIEMDYDDAAGEWTPDQQAIVNNVGEKLGLVLDNARLQGQMQVALDETRRLAEREKRAAEITSRIHSTTDVKKLLQIATEELRRSTGSARAVVKLNRDKSDS